MKNQKGYVYAFVSVLIIIGITSTVVFLIKQRKSVRENSNTTIVPVNDSKEESNVSNEEIHQEKISSSVAKGTSHEIIQSNNLIYTTKIGIQIPYPKEYSFEVNPLFNFSTVYCMNHTPESSFIEEIGTRGPVKKCIDYLIPNRGSEKIKFGFVDNEEKIEIKTSDMKNWGEIIKCEDWSQNKSYEILNISNQKVYHITSVDGLETYCTINSDYSFKLDRKISNKVKIDVSKIIFP